ncbi:hypothetical protein [Calidithermus chliarophilus]|uniref:hypothetical protein n=1 Tax=Calidithermus chliarophilus TaxID=52023 RepID=UPI00040A7D07|nr:hypothetical protein [Calidithermus chliarophilus]
MATTVDNNPALEALLNELDTTDDPQEEGELMELAHLAHLAFTRLGGPKAARQPLERLAGVLTGGPTPGLLERLQALFDGVDHQ